MPYVLLETSNVDTLPAPNASKPAILYRDEGTEGLLILRVSPTGSRVWLVECKNAAGKMKQRRFADYPTLALADARREAFRLEAIIATEGRDGVNALQGKTLRQVFDDWVQSQHPKDSTKDTYANIISTNAPLWWDRPFRAITREEVLIKCEAAWTRNALRQGDQIFETIRALANHGKIVPNPASGIKAKSKKETIEASRPLAPEALPGLFNALDSVNTEGRMYYLCMTFSGFRGLGVKAMEWSNLTLGEYPSYRIPAQAVGFKKGGDWKFPLPRYLADALEKYKVFIERTKPGTKYLFPGEGSNIDSYRKRSEGSLKSLRTLSDLPGLRDNDFRDTWASYIQALYQKNFVTERLLDHRAGGKNVGAHDVGFLYATAIPASLDLSAQMQIAAVDPGEALRPLVEGYAAAILYLAGRGPAEALWTDKERRFYDGVKRTFIDRNPRLSIEQWLTLAASHPQIAFAPPGSLDMLTPEQALQMLKPSN